jgi:signal transduction histidine kinase
LKFKSIKTKILVWFTGIIIIVLVIFSIIVLYFFRESINLKIKTELNNQVQLIQSQLSSNLLKLNNNYKIAIYKDNKIIFKNSNINFDKLIKNKMDFYIKYRDETIDAILIKKIKTPFNGKIIILKSNIDNKFESLEDSLLVSEPILLLVLLVLFSKIIDKILIPIKTITKSANFINVNNFTIKIDELNEENEINELIKAFNKMISRLKEGVEKIDNFNSDVSHELKTPISIIKGEIEFTLKKPRDTENYINSLNIINEEINRIEEITTNLLLLTSYTKENIKETFTLINLDSVLLNIIDKYESVLKQKNINLEIKELKNVKIQGNLTLIQTLFSNLIDNAIKYTPQHNSIFITLKDNEFYIRDEGIGIAKDKLQYIMDKFYRVDKSRNQKIKGYGLGLSIVKNIIELHNFKIDINSELNKGTVIKISF